METKRTEVAYFLKMEIENYRCFRKPVSLDLSNNQKWGKWNILIGDNGTGKTSVLQLLAALGAGFSYNIKDSPNFYNAFTLFEATGYLPKDYKSDSINPDPRVEAWLDVTTNVFTDKHSKGDLGLRFSSNLLLSGYSGDKNGQVLTHPCFGYGATRFMSNNVLSEIKKSISSSTSKTLFSTDAKLINAEEWLLQLDYAASKKSNVSEYYKKRRDHVRQILIDVLPDIEDIRFGLATRRNVEQTVEFLTPYGWLAINQLSLGYKTMVAWMVDLAARMFDCYPDSNNPLAEPAIVLVDEIDLHMHPKWQRKIFSYLDEKFPATQFIVTAHSPLIVQSAPSNANIVLLRKEGDHVIIDQDIKSVRSWRLDQILSSDLFDVGSRGPEIENLLQERKNLLQKPVLSEQEKERLNELNKIAHGLPTAGSQTDIEAMEVIRKAADYLKNK